MAPTAAPQDPAWMKFVFGGASCMAAACVTNPIDVIKTRLQIQGEQLAQAGQVANSRQYGGFVRGVAVIVRQEGVRGLYKGIVPSLLREGSYSTLRMGLYDMIKDRIHHGEGKMPLWKKFASGLTAGAIGAAVANPTDLVKVRMQASECASGSRYRSTWHAFSSIYKHEGLAGLFKGVGPTTQRAALLTATQLGTYDHIKHSVLQHFYPEQEGQPGWKEPIWTQFTASVCAGFFCSVVTSPIDLIKTRVMNQPTDANGVGTLYKGTVDCGMKTLRNEGPLGLYKGFFPNWFRIGPHTIVAFIAFEQLRKLFGLRPI